MIEIDLLLIVHAPIAAQEQSVHWLNALLHGDVILLGDLLIKTPDQLLDLDGVGRVVLTQVQRWLGGFGDLIIFVETKTVDHDRRESTKPYVLWPIPMPPGLTLGMELDQIQSGLARRFWMGRAAAVERAQGLWPKPPEDYGRRRPKGD